MEAWATGATIGFIFSSGDSSKFDVKLLLSNGKFSDFGAQRKRANEKWLLGDLLRIFCAIVAVKSSCPQNSRSSRKVRAHEVSQGPSPLCVMRSTEAAFALYHDFKRNDSRCLCLNQAMKN